MQSKFVILILNQLRYLNNNCLEEYICLHIFHQLATNMI